MEKRAYGLLVLIICCFLTSLNSEEFQLSFYDSYGDGWNGGTLSLSVNNEVQLDQVTLAEGGCPEYFAFNVDDGDNVSIIFTPGEWAHENMFKVHNNIGLVVYVSGADGAVPENLEFVAEVINAEYGVLSGFVTNEDENPISGALIEISNDLLSESITTDDTGHYNIELVSSLGNYNVSCMMDGYLLQVIEDVEIITDGELQLDFQLELLDGGDKIEDAFVVDSEQFNDFGSTLLYNDDYEMGNDSANDEQNSKDVVYTFTIDNYSKVSVSLEGSGYDTQMAIYSEYHYPTSCNHIYYNDDYDFENNIALGMNRRTREEKSRDRSTQSAIMNRNYDPGTYYVVIDGIMGAAGNYQISIEIDDYTPSAITEDFEFGNIPSNWTVYDANGDSNTWFVGACWLPFAKAYSGEFVISSKAFNSSGCDDWLITPKLLPTEENHILSFWYCVATNWSTEEFSVWISTTGKEIDDFTTLIEEITVIGQNDYVEYSLDLSEYLGQEIFFGIHSTSNTVDGFQIDFDAFSLPIDCSQTDLTILDQNINTSCILGADNKFEATIRNFGADVDSYNLKLYDELDNELASETYYDLPSNELAFIELNWIPEIEGNVNVYLKAEAENDILDSNNITETYQITVFPNSATVLKVGEEKILCVTESCFPVINFRPNSISETIYNASYFQESGIITAIGYDQVFVEDVNDLPIVIRIGETTETDITNGFIIADDLQTVFQGNISFDDVSVTKMIEFDTAYNYQGDNLVVMVEREMSYSYTFENNFAMSQDPNSNLISMAVGSLGNVLDPNDPNQDFLNYSYYPNTTFIIHQGNMGSLSGIVTNELNEPLEGVCVKLANSQFNIVSTSDNNGEYLLTNIPAGNYNLSAELWGYDVFSQENFEIESDVQETQNIVLMEMNTVILSGNILGNDTSGNGIANAKIILNGYNDYEIFTDETGYFQLDNVFIQNDYELTIIANRYETYTTEITVETTNILLDDIIMTELFLPVANLQAVLNESETNVAITWNSPDFGIQSEYRYDDGSPISGLGFTEANDNSVFGSVIMNNAQIDEVSWFLRDWVLHTDVKLIFLGLDENNIPDANNVIYEKEMVPNIDEQWNTHSFEIPLVIEGGFFYGIMTPGVATYIGMDDGINAPYEFKTNTQYYNANLNNNEGWILNEDNDFEQNYLLRAKGLNLDNNEVLGLSQSETSLESGKIKNSEKNCRSVLNYSVYRLTEENMNNIEDWTEVGSEITETQFTDLDFQNINSGVYYYAVKANFDEGSSTYNFSNMIPKGMYATLTLNILSPLDVPLSGAEVSLYNEEESYSGITDESGTLIFNDVWLGSYTIEINKTGYNIYHENLDVYYTNEIDINMSDMLLKPINVNADLDEVALSVEVSWESPSAEIIDFRFDDGVINTGLQNPYPTAMIGTVFNNDAIVTSISCMTMGNDNIKLVIMELDEENKPDITNIIYETDLIPCLDNQWTNHNLPESLFLEDGFFVGITAVDQTFAVAVDDGAVDPYPFKENVYFAVDDWTLGENNWMGMDDYFPYNLFIRAHGINYGDLDLEPGEISLKSNSIRKSKTSSYEVVNYNFDSIIQPPEISREFVSFCLYRLLEGDEESFENWTLLSDDINETTFIDNTIDENGIYLYAVSAKYSENIVSDYSFSNSIIMDGVSINTILPIKTVVYQNYPNPFNPTTNIKFSLKEETDVELTIYNILGQKVKTLINNKLEKGNHNILWNGKDNREKDTSSGVYFYKFKTKNYEKIHKMILMK